MKSNMTSEEKKDESFMSFFEEMLDQVDANPLVINPIKGDFKRTLSILTQSQSITRSGEVFHFYITKNS
jgi:hypothetical protein